MFNNTTNHHHYYYYYYIILVFNTTLCFEPFGYDVLLLTILQLPLFIIWGYISYTWLIVSHDIVLALSGNWTYCLLVFLSSYWVVEDGGRDDSRIVLEGEGVNIIY
jgi:hypothetical protein